MTEAPPLTRSVWRRRQVLPVRVTWIGLVAVLGLLVHKRLGQVFPMGMSLKALLFIGVVVLPTLFLALWRAGLLPPERVEVPVEPFTPPPKPR
jgi:hypothetical protein